MMIRSSSFWKATKIVALALVLLIPFTGPAQAYLDPGSVSLVFQMLVAAVLGSLVVLRLQWDKVKAFFSRKKKKESGEEVGPGGA